MAQEERKRHNEIVARIETTGMPGVLPAFGGSVEQLPATFWKRFADSLTRAEADDRLDAEEWLLVESARVFVHHCAAEIVSSTLWSTFIPMLGSEEANMDDVLHGTFAALSGVGLDACRIVELVPFERLVLQVSSYQGLIRIGPVASRAAASLTVRGLAAGVMDLAYGNSSPRSVLPARTFDAHPVSSPGSGVLDEFVVTRRADARWPE